jgi:DNA-binding HxlR family transcriptional regulator
MANNRIRGVWKARVLIALSAGPGRFNTLARECRSPDPTTASRLLKKLEKEGAVIRRIISVGPPTLTEWTLTPIGHQLVPSAVALLAEAAQRRADREIEEATFKRSRPVFDHIDTGRVDGTAQ